MRDILCMSNAPETNHRRGGRPALPLRIVIVVGSPDTLVDVVGPYQIFLQASSEGGTPTGEELRRYQIDVASPEAGRLLASRGGVGLHCTTTLDEVDGPVDTIIIAGAKIVHPSPNNGRIAAWLKGHASSARRIASVCSGAFLLAEAGLLDGRRATTHWRYVRELAKRYPQVTVEPDSIYVRDGNVYTSAGMTSGMDLALALVEEDFGSEVAREVARSLVVYMRRPGGQSQFSAILRRQTREESPIKRVQDWIAEHLAEPLSVERLSEIAGMSPRNFARVFARDAGTSPGKFVEELRLEEARRILESGSESVEQVAALAGFGSIDSLQRHFSEIYATTPSEYRSRFQTALRR